MATSPTEIESVERKMPLVLEVIRENITKHGNPLALKGSEVAAWAKNLNLPKTGDLLFYTGGEYQLLPFIDSLVKTITVVDTSSKSFAFLMGIRNVLEKTGINAEKIYAQVLATDKERFNSVCYKAAKVLQNLGYNICYSGERELYSGALLYELGYWDDLREYAEYVTGVFKESQAKTIVCLSPHAAEVIKLVYPNLGINHNIEVKTFVELIWEQRDKLPKFNTSKTVAIHDSCRLARELNISEQFRDILQAVGVEFKEPIRNRDWTTCCGGPSKLLYPELSHTVASCRVEELKDTGADTFLTSCPYCLSALLMGSDKNERNRVEDFIEFMYEGVVG